MDVGLAPAEINDSEAEYNIYVDHKHGSLNSHLLASFATKSPERGKSFTLGELIERQDEAEIFTRNDQTLDDDDDSDSETDTSDEDGDE